MHQLDSLFGELRQLIGKARGPGAAVGELTERVGFLGYSSIDCIVADRTVSHLGKGAIRHSYYHYGFPKDWQTRWSRYAAFDPLLPAVAVSLWPVDLHGLRHATIGTAIQKELWDYMDSSGVTSGLGIPVHLPGGAFAAIAFFRSASRTENETQQPIRDQLFSIGQIFCRALAERFALVSDLGAGTGASLTAREVECLYWASVGKTTADTAMIIGRSNQTVRFHLESAARKLGAVNRASAVAQACSQGIIDPRQHEPGVFASWRAN